MQNQNQTAVNFNNGKAAETLIIRNAAVKTLYDVVKVDFIKEDVQILASALQFEDACCMLEECDSSRVQERPAVICGIVRS